MELAQFFSSEADRLQAEWEAGSHHALIEALILFSDNREPLPSWLADEAISLLSQALPKLAKRRGPGGGYVAATKRLEQKRLRHSWAEIALRNRQLLPPSEGLPPTRDGAFEFASLMLRGTIAQGTPEQIEKDHRAIERIAREKRGRISPEIE